MTRQRKILLINPDWRGIRRQKQPQFKRIWQPLDLAIAAALLEKDGFSVKILDNNIDRLSSQAVGRLSGNFDKVFVTSTPYDRWQCPSLDIEFFFNTIRDIPRRRLYIMGAHVTERTRAILRKSRARAAILNEPERTIHEIACRDLQTDIPPDIPGIAYLRGERLVRSSPRGYPDDLDQWPYPAYHLLDMDQYRYELMGENFAIMEGSRGCPYRCSFCYLGMYGTGYRQKRPERLLDEISYLKRQFHTKNIYFMDLEFGLNRDFLLSFCSGLIERKIGISWCCQTRVTDVDKDALRCMREAGCNLIHFGVEAGSDRVLRQTGKGIKIEDCARAIAITHEAGIRTALFLNFGFPAETVDDMDSTIGLALRLNPTLASFHLIVPFPGTRLAEEIGLDSEAFPPHLYPHFNFVHHDLKTLKRMLRKAYLRFYLRPSYLKGLISRRMRPGLDQGRLLFRMFTG